MVLSFPGQCVIISRLFCRLCWPNCAANMFWSEDCGLLSVVREASQLIDRLPPLKVISDYVCSLIDAGEWISKLEIEENK